MQFLCAYVYITILYPILDSYVKYVSCYMNEEMN